MNGKMSNEALRKLAETGASGVFDGEPQGCEHCSDEEASLWVSGQALCGRCADTPLVNAAPVLAAEVIELRARLAAAEAMAGRVKEFCDPESDDEACLRAIDALPAALSAFLDAAPGAVA